MTADGRHPETGQFLPGISGNPGGGRKGRRITTEIHKLLEEKNNKGKTQAELLAMAILMHALAGKGQYAEIVLNRTEGKVPEVVITKEVEDMSTEDLIESLRDAADALDEDGPRDPSA